MTLFQGSSTDHEALLADLEALVTANSLTLAINAAGTGYVAGELITVTGGTFTSAAIAEVTTVGGGGEVTGIRAHHAGAYSANPAATGAATTASASGTGCTLDTTPAATGWERQRFLRNLGPTVIALVVAGTGYADDDILTVVGGTFTTAATIRVTGQTAGVIDTIAIEDEGDYSVAPTGTLTTTGGTGSGATITATFNGVVGLRELILKGVGSGAEEIFVGARSYVDGGGARNWELAGFTGYLPAEQWENQTGISPGRYDDDFSAQRGGAHILLSNTTMPFWLFVTSRRIVCWAKVGSTYSSMHVGLLNPFATVAEYPYPMYIAGQTNDPNLIFSSSGIANSSIADPITSNSRGPGLLRLASGSWVDAQNRTSASSSADLHTLVVYPTGTPVASGGPAADPIAADDRVVVYGSFGWNSVIPNTGNPGSQSRRLVPTPDSVNGDVTVPIPCSLALTDGTLGVGMMGEIDGLFWISGEQDSVIISEDTITVGADRYLVFQSGTRTELFSFCAMKEE